MRGLFALGCACSFAIAAACHSYDEAPSIETQEADDAGDAMTGDATSGNDGSALDGSADGSDAGIMNGMVVVTTAGARFAIDAREVTVKEWADFRDTHPFDAGLMPSSCSFKTAPTTRSRLIPPTA